MRRGDGVRVFAMESCRLVQRQALRQCYIYVKHSSCDVLACSSYARLSDASTRAVAYCKKLGECRRASVFTFYGRAWMQVRPSLSLEPASSPARIPIEVFVRVIQGADSSELAACKDTSKSTNTSSAQFFTRRLEVLHQ